MGAREREAKAKARRFSRETRGPVGAAVSRAAQQDATGWMALGIGKLGTNSLATYGGVVLGESVLGEGNQLTDYPSRQLFRLGYDYVGRGGEL